MVAVVVIVVFVFFVVVMLQADVGGCGGGIYSLFVRSFNVFFEVSMEVSIFFIMPEVSSPKQPPCELQP